MKMKKCVIENEMSMKSCTFIDYESPVNLMGFELEDALHPEEGVPPQTKATICAPGLTLMNNANRTSCSLTIANATKHDSGVWRCTFEAFTVSHEAEAEMRVTIEDANPKCVRSALGKPADCSLNGGNSINYVSHFLMLLTVYLVL